MVTRRYQRDYQNLNLHRKYNGHKEIPKRLSEPRSTQDNTMVTRRYQRDYHNLNLHTDNIMNGHKKIPKRLSEP